METQNPQVYPIDTHTFSVLRGSGYVYIDKTDLMYDMTHRNMKYVFLSRPRRFGKSLLLTTLKAYFERRKELFGGAAETPQCHTQLLQPAEGPRPRLCRC